MVERVTPFDPVLIKVFADLRVSGFGGLSNTSRKSFCKNAKHSRRVHRVFWFLRKNSFLGSLRCLTLRVHRIDCDYFTKRNELRWMFQFA